MGTANPPIVSTVRLPLIGRVFDFDPPDVWDEVPPTFFISLIYAAAIFNPKPFVVLGYPPSFGVINA